MDESELIATVRMVGRLSDSHPDYTDARIRIEAWDALTTLFEKVFVSTLAGYWLQPFDAPIVAGTKQYRFPTRAIANGLKGVQASDGRNFRPLRHYNQRDEGQWEGSTGEPRAFVDEGDHLRLVPTPGFGGWTLRLWFYIRPPKLYQKQTAGRITAVNTATRQITVNALPLDRITGLTITTATLLDVVAADGANDVHLFDAPIASIIGSVITVDGTQAMDRVAVGNYVRAADQSDWPMLINEFHRTLADATATVILSDMGMADKAAVLASKVQSDIVRLEDLIQPRIKDALRPMKPRWGALRSRSIRRWPVAPG